MKYILPILTVLLFPFGYWICLYIYPNDRIKFFDLRMNLIACILLAAFVLLNKYATNKKLVFIFDIGLGMSISDVVDRLYFDVTKFQKTDIIMICLTVLFAFVKYNKYRIKLFLWPAKK